MSEQIKPKRDIDVNLPLTSPEAISILVQAVTGGAMPDTKHKIISTALTELTGVSWSYSKSHAVYVASQPTQDQKNSTTRGGLRKC